MKTIEIDLPVNSNPAIDPVVHAFDVVVFFVKVFVDDFGAAFEAALGAPPVTVHSETR